VFVSSPYRRILVTGGHGLLGHGLQAIAPDLPGRTFVFCGSRDADLRDPSATRALFERVAPDAVLHLAAVSGGVQFSTERPATLLRDNVLMNLNVLEAARLTAVKKVVVTLSTGMYAPDAPLPIVEQAVHDGPPHPSNYSYAFAKRLLEPSIRAWRTEYGLNVIGLAANGIFGEHANFRPTEAVMVAGLLRRFYENRAGGDPLVVWGDGSPLREYTYARDLARAFVWCLDHYDDPQFLHVGSTEEWSVRDTAHLIAELLGIDRARVVFDTGKPGGVFRKSTDNSRFVHLSHFVYTPFREGMARMVDWFATNYAVPGAVRL
jgi:GDP-L-fucose synthase